MTFRLNKIIASNNIYLTHWVFLILIFLMIGIKVNAQKIKIPEVLTNIELEKQGPYLDLNGNKIYALPGTAGLSHDQFYKNISGTNKGLVINVKRKGMNGLIYYGFIPIGDSRYPHPVFFSRTVKLNEGVAEIPIKDMKGNFDMIGWTTEGIGILGYRIMDNNNNMLFDGKINFNAKDFLTTDGVVKEVAYGKKAALKPKPFLVELSLIEGPFIANVTHESVVVHAKTNYRARIVVSANNKKFPSGGKTFHEIEVTGLEPDKEYEYTIQYGFFTEKYSFRTAPAPGSRTKFSFSYASDSRSGNGGGERSLGGTNAYIMKKIMALNMQEKVRFMQFSGDMITGYKENPNTVELEYVNWKRAIEPYARYIPVITAMGNHEVIVKNFINPNDNFRYQVDNFPYDKVSSEAIYVQEFVNPLNGPDSEDGSKYDPDNEEVNFPSYKENVFYYIYDNIAMVVLNSNYWFTTSPKAVEVVGGNPHGYIMDNQLKWFEETMTDLENNSDIDHIFVTVHTPFFPNGGHVHDVMWYKGDNSVRPVIAGQKVDKGIIERRDELLDIIVNKSKKTAAILTGDEHNYARTRVGPTTNIYPNKYEPEKITLSREIWQINNGAAGAPYYAQEQMPWTDHVEGFTTQNALVIFDIDGKNIQMRVLNPDTLEEFDTLDFQ